PDCICFQTKRPPQVPEAAFSTVAEQRCLSNKGKGSPLLFQFAFNGLVFYNVHVHARRGVRATDPAVPAFVGVLRKENLFSPTVVDQKTVAAAILKQVLWFPYPVVRCGTARAKGRWEETPGLVLCAG